MDPQPLRPRPVPLTVLFLGLTTIFIAYFQIWLPGPAVGLQIIGIEIGEWIKFLGVGPRRDLFYLPPIVVGLVIALLAATWPNSRWQTWTARGLAVAVSLLSLPAIAVIRNEPPREWVARLGLIALVVLVAALGALLNQRATRSPWPWLMMVDVALVGALLPTLQYLAVRPVVREIMLRPIGIGLGVWLNVAGSLLVVATALAIFFELIRAQQKRQPPEG